MKKRLTIILAIALVTLSGCKHTSDYKQSEMQTITNSGIYYIGEWTSPDGVHYWILDGGSHLGLAPRYDSNGDLVISTKGE